MTTTSETTGAAVPTGPDVIDQMAGVAAESALSAVRATRPDVVRTAQTSYEALVTPATPGGLSLVERAQVALRAALLTPSAPGVAWYQARLADLGAADDAGVAEDFPEGEAPPRLAAILRHTDLLTTEPAAATPADLDALKAAGLSAAEIVTLSQLIAFVSFQVRVVAGLRALAGGEGA